MKKKRDKEITNQKQRLNFDAQEYIKYFSEEYLQKLQEYTNQLIDKAIDAQRQMKEEGITIPPVTGNYVQDVLDIAEYSNEILRRAELLGQIEEDQEEI